MTLRLTLNPVLLVRLDSGSMIYTVGAYWTLLAAPEDNTLDAAVLRGKAFVNSTEFPSPNPVDFKRREKDYKDEIANCGYRVRHYLDHREQLLTELQNLSAEHLMQQSPAALPTEDVELPSSPPEVRLCQSFRWLGANLCASPLPSSFPDFTPLAC